MDITPSRCAARFVGYTLAMAAVLVAPAILQAVMLLRPGLVPTQSAAAVSSCVLAAVMVAVPLLLQSLLDTGHRALPP